MCFYDFAYNKMESISVPVLVLIVMVLLTSSANLVFSIIIMKHLKKKRGPEVQVPQKETAETQTSIVMLYSASADSSVPTVQESNYSLKESSKFGFAKKNLSTSLILSGRGKSSSSEAILR